MKKILVTIIFLCLSLTGCKENTGTPDPSNSGKPNDVSNTSGVSNMKEIEFTEIEWAGIDWDKIEFPIDSKEIKTSVDIKSISGRDDAIQIGEAIIENCWNNKKFLDYVFLTVVHSTADNIWRFDYSIDQRDKTDDTSLLCGGFYVAINGNNGEIIKAWVEE